MRWLPDWKRRRTDRRPAPTPPIELTIFTRADCHLCDEMKAEIARAGVAHLYTLLEVDIDRDPRLVDEYGRSIPVLAIGGRAVFKGRLTVAAFRRKLERRIQDERGR